LCCRKNIRRWYNLKGKVGVFMEKYNVLVVDDEDEIRDAIEIYLKSENIKVLKVKDGMKVTIKIR
jgi:DNA-binding NtrC family response regulator